MYILDESARMHNEMHNLCSRSRAPAELSSAAPPTPAIFSDFFVLVRMAATNSRVAKSAARMRVGVFLTTLGTAVLWFFGWAPVVRAPSVSPAPVAPVPPLAQVMAQGWAQGGEEVVARPPDTEPDTGGPVNMSVLPSGVGGDTRSLEQGKVGNAVFDHRSCCWSRRSLGRCAAGRSAPRSCPGRALQDVQQGQKAL